VGSPHFCPALLLEPLIFPSLVRSVPCVRVHLRHQETAMSRSPAQLRSRNVAYGKHRLSCRPSQEFPRPKRSTTSIAHSQPSLPAISRIPRFQDLTSQRDHPLKSLACALTSTGSNLEVVRAPLPDLHTSQTFRHPLRRYLDSSS